jgi:hypothetical protein
VGNDKKEERRVQKTKILCVIANDAAPGDERRPGYTGVGANFKVRLDDALDWVAEKLPHASTVWAFGAGTDERHAGGPCLAVMCYHHLKSVITHNPRRWVNSFDNNYYGTLEEIQWIVNQAENDFLEDTAEFVFFTQRRHMWRVKLIWWLFHQHKWGRATFVVTDQVEELPLVHELGGMWKAWRVYRGKQKPRYETPYPSIDTKPSYGT